MKVTSVLGIDVSKKSLDCHLHVQCQPLLKVSNCTKGFKDLHRQLKKHLKTTEGLLVVMEHTGIYTYELERFLNDEGIGFVKRPALDIKRSE